jgi:hypothetical protein
MDPALISAFSAVLGSLVGGSASIATAWFTQKTQGRREMVSAEIQKREQLYADFIAECSRLSIDALGHSLEKADTLVKVYALHNRIRLVSSDAVVDAASHSIKRILEFYFAPNVTREQLQEMALSMKEDPLRIFSEACRHEIAGLRYWT